MALLLVAGWPLIADDEDVVPEDDSTLAGTIDQGLGVAQGDLADAWVSQPSPQSANELAGTLAQAGCVRTGMRLLRGGGTIGGGRLHAQNIGLNDKRSQYKSVIRPSQVVIGLILEFIQVLADSVAGLDDVG
jgi:hypothetical protein